MILGTNRPQAMSITDKGWELLEVIRSFGEDGCTRRDLVDRLGKFNNWTRAQLELLSSEGYIAIEERRVANSPLIQYIYRAR